MSISSSGDSVPPAGSLARLAAAVYFFILGFMVATWVTHIPTIKNRLGISSGELGMALLGIAIGSIFSMYAIGVLLPRWGSRKLTVAGSLLGTMLMALPVLAPSYPLLLGAFIALGAANGSAVVAMNAQGVAIEKRLGRFVMSSLHAMFSIGGLSGSLFGLLMLSAGISPAAHSLIAAAIGIALALLTKRFLLPDPGDSAHSSAKGYFPPRGNLLLLGVLTFVTLMTEGAVADWSALYLNQQAGLKSELAGLGYAGFSLAMAIGRFAGDRLAHVFGRGTLLRVGGTLAALGFTTLVFFNYYVTAIAGFIGVGFGVSNVIPLLFGTAGNIKNVPPGVGIATASALGHMGFLVGPPLVGFLADGIGLAYALGIFVIFMGLVAALGGWVERQTDTAA
ncbi:MAG TPA: MFS transporter [Gammaproteobacteria bacterium]|nr:MFS transporter [Gammaproteobacteria bacterium]